MGRVRGYIDVNGKRLWTLFDSGARNTYIVEDASKSLATAKLERAEPSALGGRTHIITHECLLIGRVEEYSMSVDARIVADIGIDEDRRRIEVLFGALAMQKYGIKVDVAGERLDFTNYPREFVEF